MTSTFIFVRHGAANKTNDASGKTVDLGLTPCGIAHARDAGRRLLALSITPQLIVHTSTPRTRQTAQLIAAAYAEVIPMRQARAGFRDLDGLDAKLAKWTRSSPAEVVLFCGHHSSQQALTRAFRLDLKRAERGVILLEPTTGECRTIEVGSG
ncbi:MAG: phosphoglycerate mutase family protein [Myxococcota bacterium]|nr:phosphoglycerate mutase family protein [Myxococcota bacterium]